VKPGKARAEILIDRQVAVACFAHPPPNSPEVLFVQTAKKVAFKVGTLTLEDASPATAFFSERPNRIVGQIRNDLFLKQWTEGKNSFKSDPPNAFLTVFNEGTRPTGVTVVLHPYAFSSGRRPKLTRTIGRASSRRSARVS